MHFFCTLYEMIFDMIAPPRARTLHTRKLSPADFTSSPHTHTLHSIKVTTILEYHSIQVRDAIHALKYDASSHAAQLLADILADYLTEEVAHAKLFSAKKVLIVPIPLHPSREKERGYNQMQKVLSRLPKEFRDGSAATLAPHIIARTRATPHQTRLTRRERLKNVAGAFTVLYPASTRDTAIFLIDDVTTTGATLAHAAKTLEKAGAQVHCVALARA